jgi:hypothetical protein
MEHDEMVRSIAKWLEKNGFLVLTNYQLPVEAPKLAVLYTISYMRDRKRGEKRTSPEIIVKPDILAYDEKSNASFVIEVSKTSDLKREAKKIRRIKVDGRLIVTPSWEQEGELDGIPIVAFDNLDGEALYVALTGKLHRLRKRRDKERKSSF